MAYYYLKIYNARDNHENSRTGTKGKERAGHPVFEFTSGNVANASIGAAQCIAAKNEHSLYRNVDLPTSTLVLGLGDYDDPTRSPWSYNFGKGVYAYKVGVHGASASEAKEDSEYKDLS